MPPVMLGPDGKPLEVVPVESTGEDAWAGVARVDRGADEDQAGSGWSNTALLVAGDAAALLLFAAVGRANHGLDLDALQTALPFLLGWFPSAALLGGFGPEARGKGVASAATTAAKCWAVGIPAGLLLRGLSKGYVPPTPFIIVSLVANAVLLVGWRSALAAATKQAAPLSPAAKAAQRRDKQGNPFEFLELLMSLTKRW